MHSKLFELIGCLSAWLRLDPLAKPCPVIYLHWSLSFYSNIYILPNNSVCPLYFCLLTNIHRQLHNILSEYFSKWNSRLNYIQNLVEIPWLILANFFLILIFLLVYIVLTVINTVSALFWDRCVAWINPGTFCEQLSCRCSGVSQSSMLLSSSMSDSLSASQSTLLSFGLSKSSFQSSQFSVSEMLSGAPSSTLYAGWRSICLIGRTFNTWVCPPGRCFADYAGGKGDFSDNLNAAAPSCWKFQQDALTIYPVPEMYPMAVIYLFSVKDSFCVASRFWLPCHISRELWTLAILCIFICSASCFISKSVSEFVVSNAGHRLPITWY